MNCGESSGKNATPTYVLLKKIRNSRTVFVQLIFNIAK